MLQALSQLGNWAFLCCLDTSHCIVIESPYAQAVRFMTLFQLSSTTSVNHGVCSAAIDRRPSPSPVSLQQQQQQQAQQQQAQQQQQLLNQLAGYQEGMPVIIEPCKLL